MRITNVEIHHLGEDERGSVILAVLTVTRADGSSFECEIGIPQAAPEGA